jgi:hypothetical protein
LSDQIGKKTEVIDDWDSLPLEPNDDWDAPAPPARAAWGDVDSPDLKTQDPDWLDPQPAESASSMAPLPFDADVNLDDEGDNDADGKASDGENGLTAAPIDLSDSVKAVNTVVQPAPEAGTGIVNPVPAKRPKPMLDDWDDGIADVPAESIGPSSLAGDDLLEGLSVPPLASDRSGASGPGGGIGGATGTLGGRKDRSGFDASSNLELDAGFQDSHQIPGQDPFLDQFQDPFQDAPSDFEEPAVSGRSGSQLDMDYSATAASGTSAWPDQVSDTGHKAPGATGHRAGLPAERPARDLGAVDDQGRNDFLKSLMDGDDEVVPQRVELDLDGIFEQARREQISPEATHQPVEAPVAEDELPNEIIDDLSLTHGGSVKKVPKYKMFMVFGTSGLVIIGLFFAIYSIFFRDTPSVPQSKPFLVEPDLLTDSRVPLPGEMPPERFTIILDSGSSETAVLEMEIILHYRDTHDAVLIKREITSIRDLIFRLTKEVGPSIFNNQDLRRQLQADLMITINNIDSLRSDPADPRLTYVQISLLSRR